MINATTARINVRNYNKKVIEAKQKRVDEFLNTTVNAKIVENSKLGYNTCSVAIPSEQDKKLIMTKIKQLGFTVEDFNGAIIIEW